MLPIPAPIIGSSSASVYHRKLFIPLIYLGATASICYLFLFAFIVSNQTFRRSGENLIGYSKRRDLPEENNRINYHSDQIEHHKNKQSDSNTRESGRNTEQRNQFYLATNRKRRDEREQLALSSSIATLPETVSTSTQPQPHFERKKLSSLRKRIDKGGSKNGTWRSNPTKIWSGHQDLDLHNSILDRIGHNGGKLSKEVYTYPWIRDEQCKTFTVQFARKDTFKPRALVSFPGSGNSWLRYMIECASGYFTGSVYDDKELFTAGLLGEVRPPNDGCTIVQKTHHDTIYNLSSRQRKAYTKLSELMFGYRGLLLIRNPYDALVSYWNFINTHGHHKWIARRSEFDDIRWTKFVTEQIPRWTSLIMSWAENSQDFLIIFYEEVQKNPREELIRILEYLDQPVDTGRLDCLMKPENLEGPFHRPHLQQKTSRSPLAVDLIPVTTSQQDKNIQVEHQTDHQDQNEAQTLLLLNSKKSQQHQQHHPKSPTNREVEEEQKEDKFLSSSSPHPPFQTISTQQQHENQYTSNMSSSTSSNDNHHHQHQQYHHHDNNHLNGSILRLDLIIQDNIDKINRFFQQKGIPAQLKYSPRPNIQPYFLHTVQ